MKKIKLSLSLMLLVFSTFSAFSQNPKIENGVATYSSSINIGRKFKVPDEWKKIVIKANVTITGSFYMPTRTSPIEIMGENRKTSLIQGDGSRPTDDGINGRSYSAIRADKSPDIYVHDLTVTKPMKFHIHGGFGNVTVERCDIVAGSFTHTTDGIHGGVGKTVVKDCYINCYDDALYTVECKLVENTTIVHNKNGGPFMTSWGNGVPNGHVCVIRNCTVIAGHNGTDYNHGVVSWAGKSSASNVKETLTLKFEGTFEYIVPSDKKASTFYTIGRPNDPGLNNAHIVVDGQCHNKNSIDLRKSFNSSVTFKNCSVGTPIPTNITDLALTSTSCKSVNLAWSDVSGETGYRIRRKTATTDYVTLADLPANSKSYVDATAAEQATYQYMVRPMQGGIEAAVSNTPQILTAACATDPVPVDTFLKAFPNPTTGILTLPEVLANDQIKVVSQQSGLTVLSKTIQQSGSTQLNISNQPAGSYTIQLVRNNQLLTRQIIKL